MTNTIPPPSFVIREDWCEGLWRDWLSDAVFLSGPFLLILPMGMWLPAKICLAAVLGGAAADAFIFMHKREHVLRHTAEASFLGFGHAVRGSLWNPFSVPELLLYKEPGDPQEDRLLADLVIMHGPTYGLGAGGPPAWWGGAAAAVQCGLALLALYFPRLAPLVLPLSGVTMLFFLLSKAEAGFARAEGRRMSRETLGFRAPGADYYQWNFLSLEAKRILSGRVPLMAEEIGKVLLGEAGFRGGAAILEAGAGGGFLWKLLPAELRAGWTEMEKNPHAALYARRHKNGSVFLEGDLKSIPFKDASFDGIAGLECFDSLNTKDLLEFLREAKRVLRPGGRLVHLKDFADWPCADITARLRSFTLRALRRELVANSGKRLVFPDIGADEAAALNAAAGKEPPALRPYAQVLADMYASAGGRDPRLTVPMLFSLRVLEAFFVAAGFAVLTDSMSPGREAGAVAYIVAVKPR